MEHSPGVVKVRETLLLEDGDEPLEAGATVLLLGRVEDELICLAGGGRFFHVPVSEVERRFATVAPSSGGDERHAMGLVLSLLLVGGAGLVAAESAEGGTIGTLGDALWYGINTISTVGVGDVAPETPLGKLIASGMMVLGNPLYAKFGEELVAPLLGGGRSGVAALAEQVEGHFRATS